MGLFDKVKDMVPDDKEELQKLAGQADDQAEKLGKKDGTVGDLADKAHSVLDKVDDDPNPKKP